MPIVGVFVFARSFLGGIRKNQIKVALAWQHFWHTIALPLNGALANQLVPLQSKTSRVESLLAAAMNLDHCLPGASIMQTLPRGLS